MRRRERTDPRSPVQPDRTGPLPFIVLAILALAVLWTLRDDRISDLAPPYESEAGDRSTRTADPATRRSDSARSARGDLTGLFSASDYPIEALRNEEQGTVAAGLTIDPSGRVTDCTVLASSGSESLDRATCSILSRRPRFTPARDENGRAVPDSYTQRITWRLQ